MIVDSHTHVFAEISGRIGDDPTRGLAYGRVRIGDQQTIQTLPPFCKETSFPPEALLTHMDWAGVDKVVLLQGLFYGECNAYALDAVNRYPDRLKAAAYIDPWAEGARQAFEAIAEEPGFCAVKLECSVASGFCGVYPDARLDAPDVGWLWEGAAASGKVLVLDLGGIGERSYQTGAVQTIAETYPGMKIVIAHLGQPGAGVDADETQRALWFEQLDLARLPNVWFDTASLMTYVREEFPFPTATRHLHQALDRIGSHKVLWGTDIPGNLVHLAYPKFLTLIRQQIRNLSPSKQAMILGENAAGVFGFR